jgi:transcriptional regulator with XRE-family HTH domain
MAPLRLTRLRDLRKAKLETLESLSAKTGLTPAAISRIEHLHVEPRPSTVRRLARALRVRPEELFEEGK